MDRSAPDPVCRALQRLLLCLLGATATACGPFGAPSPAPDVAEPAVPAAAHDPAPDVFSVELGGEAATTYRTEGTRTPATPLGRRIRARFPELAVDPCLESAAKAHLGAPPPLAERMPLAFTEFALHWAGCPDATATVSELLTTEDDDGAVLRLLADLLSADRYTHVGAARAAAGPPYSARWLVLLANRGFSLHPVPTSGEPGSTLAVQFRVDPQLARVTVAVTHPRGEVHTIETGLSDGLGVASIPLADQVGRQWIELIGHGRTGPHVLALFPVSVGRPPPRLWVGQARPDESWIDTEEDAESFAADLIRTDRERFDLPEVIRDPELDAIARAYSREMADAGFFAHVSPTSGSIVDRLEASGYPATFAAENIAMGSNLSEAQDSLMRSPAHRATILAPQATHFGVGVAFRRHELVTMRLLTQIFVARLEVARS